MGCATWQKCFNLAPRCALTLGLASLFFAYVPWGFGSFLASRGAAGTGIQVTVEALALAFGVGSLLVAAQALLRAALFLEHYHRRVPALRPPFALPRRGLGLLAVRVLAQSTWAPAAA